MLITSMKIKRQRRREGEEDWLLPHPKINTQTHVPAHTHMHRQARSFFVLITAFTIRQTVITLFMQQGDPWQLMLGGHFSSSAWWQDAAFTSQASRAHTHTYTHSVCKIISPLGRVLEQGCVLASLLGATAFSDEKAWKKGVNLQEEKKRSWIKLQKTNFIRYQMTDMNIFWRKSQTAAFEPNIWCQIAAGAEVSSAMASYRQVG